MPTRFLNDQCRLQGTSYSEHGRGVRIVPKEDETIRFYHLDCVAFRTEYHLRDQPVCDLLVSCDRSRETPINLFVELKGAGGYGHAVAQIEGAFGTLRDELTGCQGDVRFRALVVGAGSSPPNKPMLVKRLSRKGVSLEFKTGWQRGTYDIRPHLENRRH